MSLAVNHDWLRVSTQLSKLSGSRYERCSWRCSDLVTPPPLKLKPYFCTVIFERPKKIRNKSFESCCKETKEFPAEFPNSLLLNILPNLKRVGGWELHKTRHRIRDCTGKVDAGLNYFKIWDILILAKSYQVSITQTWGKREVSARM